MQQSFSIKLHSETQISGRLGLIPETLTMGAKENALNNLPPSHHHLYIIHLIN